MLNQTQIISSPKVDFPTLHSCCSPNLLPPQSAPFLHLSSLANYSHLKKETVSLPKTATLIIVLNYCTNFKPYPFAKEKCSCLSKLLLIALLIVAIPVFWS